MKERQILAFPFIRGGLGIRLRKVIGENPRLVLKNTYLGAPFITLDVNTGSESNHRPEDFVVDHIRVFLLKCVKHSTDAEDTVLMFRIELKGRSLFQTKLLTEIY